MTGHSTEELRELRDDICPDMMADAVDNFDDVQAVEGFEDGAFTKRLAHISERYLVGYVEIHVHLCLIGGRLERGEYCASFIRATPKDGSAGRNEDIRTRGDQSSGYREVQQVERTVLVPVVQGVEPSEGMPVGVMQVLSLERLQPLDDCFRSWEHAPDFRQSTAPRIAVSAGIPEDRERRLVSDGLTVRPDEFASEVVQGGSEVVDHVSNNRAQGRRGDACLSLSAEDISAAVRIELAGDDIWFWTDEPVNRFVESIAVMVRAVEFGEASAESVAHG